MDQWQIMHICAHQHKLEASTICKKQLINALESNSALEKSEKETLESIRDQSERVKLLYNILEEKSNGYWLLLEAFAACNQTEPYNILLNGFAQTAIPNLKVNILGSIQKLGEFFKESELEKIILNYRAHARVQEYAQLGRNDDTRTENEPPIILVNDFIPPKHPFYIPRLLHRRIKVNSQLLRVDSCDINSIKGVDNIQLSNITTTRRPSACSIVTCLQEAPSCRHFIVESKEDFEKNCMLTKVPVHLILPHDDKSDHSYILESSSHGSITSFEYFHRKGNNANKRRKSVAVSEDEFLEEGSGIGIFDLPGTGKSLLLANLAKKMKQAHPERIVAFVKFSQFVEFVVKEDKKLAFAVNNSSFLRKCLLQYLSTSYFAFCVLTELVGKDSVHMELFLDAFDEVQGQHVKIAKAFLSALSNDMPRINARIYVTSRPYMQHELEACLSHISYDILPLTHTNQTDLLTNYWCHLHPKCDKEKINEFSHFCVQQLNEHVNEKERRIAGIPLQCRLAGEVFATSVKIFANSSSSNNNSTLSLEKLCKLNTSLYELYEKHVNLQFHKSIYRPSATEIDKCSLFFIAPLAKRMMEAVIGNYTYFSELEEIKNYHMLVALNILFPQSTKLFSHMLTVELNSITMEYPSNIFSLGMLEKRLVGRHESVHFVHRTFAEYLAAEILSDALVQLHQSRWTEALRKQLLRFLFKTVLKTEKINDEYGGSDNYAFVYHVSVYFLNFACAEKGVSCPNELAVATFSCLVTGDQLYALLHAILRDNHHNIFNLIINLLSRMSRFQLWKYKTKLFPSDDRTRITRLVNTAARCSSLILTSQLFLLFREHFDVDLDVICKDVLLDADTPLNAAVRRLDYEMVQYFSGKFSLDGTNLLEHCVQSSIFDLPEIIEKRIKICRLLLRKSRDSIMGHNNNNSTLHQAFEFGAHLDIVKFLIKEGANIRAKVDDETVVHRAARYMSADDFHEFCRFLLKDCGVKELFVSNDTNWSSPLPYILKDNKIQEHTIEMIIENEKDEQSFRQSQSFTFVDLNCKDTNGRPLLMCAVLGKRCISILKALIEMGVNIMAADWNGNTFAHLISQYYSAKEYHEIVKLLIEKGMGRSYQVTNKIGETPLHRGVLHLELLPETFDLLTRCYLYDIDEGSSVVDLNAVDHNGNSILHLALSGRRSLDFVSHLVKLGASWDNGQNISLVHKCVEYGLLDHLKYFVELGCSTNEKDSIDIHSTIQVALENAYYENTPEIVEFLLAGEVLKGNVNMEQNWRQNRRRRVQVEQ